MEDSSLMRLEAVWGPCTCFFPANTLDSLMLFCKQVVVKTEQITTHAVQKSAVQACGSFFELNFGIVLVCGRVLSRNSMVDHESSIQQACHTTSKGQEWAKHGKVVKFYETL